MIITQPYNRPTGPYSAVRLGELPQAAQEHTESSGPEPVDEMVPTVGTESTSVAREPSMSTQSMAQHSNRSAGTALAAFPQVVHVLSNPELHLGKHLAEQTGLPLVTLDKTNSDTLEGLLHQPEYADGFILEGFPVDRQAAEQLDSLLGATPPSEHRVLGWDVESPQQQEIVDHYVDQGLMWMVPGPGRENQELVKSSLVECLAGLPVRK